MRCTIPTYNIYFLAFLVCLSSIQTTVVGQTKQDMPRKDQIILYPDTLKATSSATPDVRKTENRAEEKDSVRTIDNVDLIPRFAGGEEAMYRYITNNRVYPVIYRHPQPKGRVAIRVIIDKDGKVCSPTIIRGVDPFIDAEAIRLVKSMPKWEPAILDGTPVACYYVLPILFRYD